MMPITCARCGEYITAPYFHDGKPYGYSCIKIVNPLSKKSKDKGHWIIPESHNLDTAIGKQFIVSIVGNKKYKSLLVKDIISHKYVSLDPNCIIGANNVVYIKIG